MSIYEYVGNPHVHTRYSDGEALHVDVIQAASDAGLDFVITTDHNVWVNGCERYYGKRLLLVGEEVHDVRHQPPANHLLAYNAGGELAPLAPDPQKLIDAINERGGLAFLAHPFEYRSPIGPDLMAIPWVDWNVQGYAGLEIWNYMSEFKALLRSKLSAIYFAYFPVRGIRGPFRATLRQWDQLLARGQRVAAIGGADAHGTTYSMGTLQRMVFPYEYLFRCVNTHILTDRPLSRRLEQDKSLIYDALRAGHTWVGYDLIGSTAGFRYTARSLNNRASMGDELRRTGATVFEVLTPQSGDIRLVTQGQVVARAKGKGLKFTTAQPGAYRVEVYRRGRGWIFSSPIYVT
jgi:hypothetical protein